MLWCNKFRYTDFISVFTVFSICIMNFSGKHKYLKCSQASVAENSLCTLPKMQTSVSETHQYNRCCPSCSFSCSLVSQLKHSQALDHDSKAQEREGTCYTGEGGEKEKECFLFSENAESHSIVLYLVKCLFAVAECNTSKQQFYHIGIFHTFTCCRTSTQTWISRAKFRQGEHSFHYSIKKRRRNGVHKMRETKH